MTSLYPLYDALVAINIPNEKARAVVDAMERDLTTTLATKADLAMLRQEMAGLATRQELRQEVSDLRQEIVLLRKDVDSRFALMSKDIEAVRSSMVIWLGSIQVVVSGVLFAALRLTA